MPDAYTTRPLSAETWDDFSALVEANNGVWGGCWCMGFHVEGFGKAPTPESNRAAKRAHADRGTVHQILVYDADGSCVGWSSTELRKSCPISRTQPSTPLARQSYPRGGSGASSPEAATAAVVSPVRLSRPRWTRSRLPAAEW